jgi:uncharacterized membrane protein YqjE
VAQLAVEEEKEANIELLKTRSLILLLYIFFTVIPLTPMFVIAYCQDNEYLWLSGLIIGIFLSIPAIFIIYRFLKSLVSVTVDKTIKK